MLRETTMTRFGQYIATTMIVLLAALASADAETIAVLTKNYSSPIFVALRAGANAAGKALGVQVVNYVPSTADNVPAQMGLIGDAIKDKPDAIVLVPVDAGKMGSAVEKISAAGIPLVNVNEKFASGDIVGYVGVDDYELARATGRYLLKAMGGKGNIVVFNGPTDNLTAQGRARGFADALKEFPDVKVISTTMAAYSRSVSSKAMKDLLYRNPQIDGVLSANDPMAMGVVEALKAANKKSLVIGINASREVMDLIRSGDVIASGDYDSFAQGCLGVELAVRHLRKEATPKEVMLKPEIIDKSNMAPFDMAVDKRQCPTLASVAGK
jgi:ribose transport system substrate-binding protein